MQKKVLDGRYELERKIGEGGMARIYAGLDRRLNRRVAIKIPHAHFLHEPDFLERFRHEAQAAAMLAHPNIVDIYDVGHDDDIHYIVMEYVDGTDLKTIINREGPLPIQRAVNLAEQIARGLYAAHRAGMVHRDIKPQNVIVTPDGQARVTDFGVAKSHLSTALTETGISFGTVEYLSPEQAQGRPATPQSDVYALGIVLYEMLTGRLPFSGDGAVAIAMKHVSEAPTPPRRLNPAIPAGLEALVLRALAKDPAQRPRDAQEFAQLLANYGQLAQQETLINPALAPQPPSSARNGLSGTLPARPQGSGTTGRVPVAPRNTAVARAPRQDGLGCGVFLVGMLVLASVLGLVYLVSSGTLGSLLGSLGGGGGGSGGNVSTPVRATATATTQPEEPTATVVAGIAVPSLVGYTAEAADTTLRGLQLLPVRQQLNDTQSAFGQVISQDIPPGTSLTPGQPVTYTMSLGPLLVEVPDLVRSPGEMASQRLQALGLGVQLLEEPSQSVDRSFVVRQTPSPGLRVPQGEVVTLVISQGDVVRFPEVIGMQRDQAEQILNATDGLVLVYVDRQGRDRLIDYDRFRVDEVVSAQIENGPGLLNGDLVQRGSRIVLGVKAGE